MSKIIVEEALVKEDILEAIRLLLLEKKEVGFDLPTPNLEKMYYALSDTATKIFMAKDVENGVVIGLSVVHLDSLWFSDSYVLTSMSLYVMPEYRKTRAVFQLLRKTKDFAKMVGVPLVISYLSNTDCDKKDKLFRLYGLEKLGSYFGSYVL